MEKREQSLKKNIRRLTKEIGVARKSHDYNQVTNARAQRAAFIKQLMEEYQVFFWIEGGKSIFGTQEEAETHYSNPEEKKKVAVARAVAELFQGRDYLKKRMKGFEEMAPDKLKEEVLKEIGDQTKRVEGNIHELQEAVGETKMDFVEVDKVKDGDDFLDGIDMSSLM